MKTVIVSGYFNPLHGGHLDMIDAAAELGDRLVVIVNNDDQQIQKKGKIILNENNRLRVMRALKHVDEAFICIDGIENDAGQVKCFKKIKEMYPDDELVFANDGDRSGAKKLPEKEVQAANEFGIELVFDISGKGKVDSSTRINQATGHEE